MSASASAVVGSKVIESLQEGDAETRCYPAVVCFDVSWGAEIWKLVHQTAADG